MKRAREYNFDPRCRDLALVFLNPATSEPLVADLASAIQDRIEDWLSFEKEPLETALSKAEEPAP